jgi:hypothetical protein
LVVFFAVFAGADFFAGATFVAGADFFAGAAFFAGATLVGGTAPSAGTGPAGPGAGAVRGSPTAGGDFFATVFLATAFFTGGLVSVAGAALSVAAAGAFTACS